MSLTKRRSRLFLLLFLIVQLFSVTVFAAECSKTKLCATGCCSSAGYCGTTTDHCGKGCQSTCDFKTECDKNNPCKGNTCCSKFGHCGLGPDCKWSSCCESIEMDADFWQFAARIVLLAVMPRASVILVALAPSSPTIPSVHLTSVVRSMGKLI